MIAKQMLHQSLAEISREAVKITQFHAYASASEVYVVIHRESAAQEIGRHPSYREV